MCGRFALFADISIIENTFGLGNLFPLSPLYNIAPSQSVLTLRGDQDATLEWCEMRWGFIPHWMKKEAIRSKFINARCETVGEKPMFKRAFQSRRCIIIASGFYEWRNSALGKQPYFIYAQDQEILSFAGIWEHWENDDEAIDSCTILTTAADAALKKIHHRMPVTLAQNTVKKWIDPTQNADSILAEVLKQQPAMAYHPVSPKVNNPRYQQADSVDEIKR